MVAWKTIFVVAMVIMFIDAIIQQITGGGIVLQGSRYTFVELLFFFIRVVTAFLGTILHAITHWNDIPQDIGILIMGLLAILWFIVGSVIDLLLHFIRLPFDLIGSWVTAFGFYIDLWAFGSLIIDFRSLSVVITLPNINEANILGTGAWVVMQNTIGFSLLGASDLTPALVNLDITNLTKLGSTVTKTLPSGLSDFISIDFNMEDYIATFPPFVDPIYFGLRNVGISASLEWVFRALVENLGIPTLVGWTNSTLDILGLIVQPSLAQMYYLIDFNIEKVKFNCQKIIN